MRSRGAHGGWLATLRADIESAERRTTPFDGSMPARLRAARHTGLDAEAVAMLEQLQPQLPLLALRSRYPRLLNRLARLRHDRRRLDDEIAMLLGRGRPQRLGFTGEIRAELLELRIASRSAPR